MLFGAFVVIVLVIWFVVMAVAWRIPEDEDEFGQSAFDIAQNIANEDTQPIPQTVIDAAREL